MDKKLKNLLKNIFGEKKFQILEFMCKNSDDNGFVLVKIEDIVKTLNISKPTIINTFKFLEEKKVLKKLKNGLYKIKIGDDYEN